MKKIFLLFLGLFVLITACQKSEKIINEPVAIADSDREKIAAMGFSTEGIIRLTDGFLVEGDIFISDKDLNKPEAFFISQLSQESEHYRSSNLVTGLPRVITIRVNSTLPASYRVATDAAIARYNAVGLKFTIHRVTTGGNIVISGSSSTFFLAMSGYPSGGQPYGSIQVSTPNLNTWAANTVTTIIAHEIGHCIGFAHTDIYDRAYSCGTSGPVTPVLSIHIPGTPTLPSPNSWMLTCITNGVDRPFTPQDLIALRVLYGI